MNKLHGGKRANSGKISGWGYPKGTPLRLIKLPVQIAEAIQAAKERMSGDELIRLLNQDLTKPPIQAHEPVAENLAAEPSTPRRNNQSGFIGVYPHKASGKWQAQLRVNGKTKALGLFTTPEQAAAAIEAYKQEKRSYGIVLP